MGLSANQRRVHRGKSRPFNYRLFAEHEHFSLMFSSPLYLYTSGVSGVSNHNLLCFPKTTSLFPSLKTLCLVVAQVLVPVIANGLAQAPRLLRALLLRCLVLGSQATEKLGLIRILKLIGSALIPSRRSTQPPCATQPPFNSTPMPDSSPPIFSERTQYLILITQVLVISLSVTINIRLSTLITESNQQEL